jgi:muramidase (phage lysozyme)
MSVTVNEKLNRFLDLIAFSEGTRTNKLTKNDGYDVIVTSIDGPSIFTDYSTHPLLGKPPLIIRGTHEKPLLRSSAAGRYQLLAHYFEVYKEQLRLPDFSPMSQDLVALQQIKERHAYQPILDGNISFSITACSNIWASFPGNDYGQGGKSLQTLLAKY